MSQNDYIEEITKGATPLKNKQALAPLIESLKDKKIVMLGESTHGTKEFYEWRKIISQELISNHGFKFIAVEGDWPPCQKIHNFINQEQTDSAQVDTRQLLSNFSRWPTWPWANTEMLDFVDWLSNWNKHATKKIGFYGLDLYSFYESIDEVLVQLKKIDPQLAADAAKHYACLGPYKHDEKAYAKSLFKTPEGCKKGITEVLAATLKKAIHSESEKEGWFLAQQNAFIVSNAESYYRAMLFGKEDSWNIRANHMTDTLKMLMEHHKHDAKAIIWAHNTHVGDYRATDMVSHKQVNMGGLAREIYGADSVGLVGFGTSSGSVLASPSWNGETTTIKLPEAEVDSVEYALHKAANRLDTPAYYLVFNSHNGPLSQIKDQRAIGVVYNPEHESKDSHVPTSLVNRYDAFIFIDHTTALTPLKVEYAKDKFPETYPHGTRI